MRQAIDLSGVWNLQLDPEKQGLQGPYTDTIVLPNTTSHAQKGSVNQEEALGYLTDSYKFEGFAWFSRTIEIGRELIGKRILLYLERTRVTTVYLDDSKVGTQNSLCTPHIYDLTDYLTEGSHRLTICVDNTDYPTRGGHMTSPDTQTNWNGITGRIELQIFEKAYLTDVRVKPDPVCRALEIQLKIEGTREGTLSVGAESYNGPVRHLVEKQEYPIEGDILTVVYPLGDKALLWSEFEPNLYYLELSLWIGGRMVDIYELSVGLREFKATGDKFTINGIKTFLRGKHDGLVFPLTGFAPTSVEEWLKAMKTAQAYGINHYRFHTCCPPEAAFIAADLLGIYVEPELPFWGTVTQEGDEKHNQAEQDYLVEEGLRILSYFGNHPSFVMMSMGNELWGSKPRINEIIKTLKAYDNRPLYTQGSNNFQFYPEILEQEDFFCGVRFSKDRLIRGSYAMCDAPLGHVQTGEPNTLRDYDAHIVPEGLRESEKSAEASKTIEIQYGTGVKKVDAAQSGEVLIPKIPVVSHEIGQYETYPDFDEIRKYTGSLKPRNLEAFKKRLEDKGMGDLAHSFFMASGKLAAACYKEELEAAYRSRRLAGFQLLDLQDFPGQGTALVGVLDAFMDPKGIISPQEWRSFCSDAVLLARFDKYNYMSGEPITAHIELACFRKARLEKVELAWSIRNSDKVYASGVIEAANAPDGNYIDIGNIAVILPEPAAMEKVTLMMSLIGTDIVKNYDLWLYPRSVSIDRMGLNIFEGLTDQAVGCLERGEAVLLLPKPHALKNAIEGFYCTDFWCYPMFRSISESMNKPVPVGTMGLLIDNTHPSLKDFPCEEYSTYPWWHMVQNSCAIILDETPGDFRPIVQTIDNFERNHKLGMLFECKALNGRLLVCSVDFSKIMDMPEARQLLYSLTGYVRSEAFRPAKTLTLETLKQVLR